MACKRRRFFKLLIFISILFNFIFAQVIRDYVASGPNPEDATKGIN